MLSLPTPPRLQAKIDPNRTLKDKRWYSNNPCRDELGSCAEQLMVDKIVVLHVVDPTVWELLKHYPSIRKRRAVWNRDRNKRDILQVTKAVAEAHPDIFALNIPRKRRAQIIFSIIQRVKKKMMAAIRRGNAALHGGERDQPLSHHPRRELIQSEDEDEEEDYAQTSHGLSLAHDRALGTAERSADAAYSRPVVLVQNGGISALHQSVGTPEEMPKARRRPKSASPVQLAAIASEVATENIPAIQTFVASNLYTFVIDPNGITIEVFHHSGTNIFFGAFAKNLVDPNAKKQEIDVKTWDNISLAQLTAQMNNHELPNGQRFYNNKIDQLQWILDGKSRRIDGQSGFEFACRRLYEEEIRRHPSRIPALEFQTVLRDVSMRDHLPQREPMIELSSSQTNSSLSSVQEIKPPSRPQQLERYPPLPYVKQGNARPWNMTPPSGQIFHPR